MKSLAAGREAALRRRLLRWFATAQRDLPWRFPAGKADPYRVWISEVMLQQTQVATVVPYYRRFLRSFPTLGALAQAGEDEVLALWSGLGYYGRGRALLRAAREACQRWGALPGTLEELRSLPGFGPYTAGAVASIAYGLRVPAVDGNAARVLSRLLCVGDSPHSARFRERVWGAASALVGTPRRAGAPPGVVNQALMELGALVCRPAPRCERCPLETLCGARAAGRERFLPARGRRPKQRSVRMAIGVCIHGGRVLLVRRPARGLFGGTWAPPTIELRDEEDAGSSISREISREPSAITGAFRHAGTIERVLTHRRLELVVLTAKVTRLPPRGGNWRLARSGDLESFGVAAAMRQALALAGIGAGAQLPTRRSGAN